MASLRLLRPLLLPFAVLAVLALAGLYAVTAYTVTGLHRAREAEMLQAVAALRADTLTEHLAGAERPSADGVAQACAAAFGPVGGGLPPGHALTVLVPSGDVVCRVGADANGSADSAPDAAVRDALAGTAGRRVVYPAGEHPVRLAVAVPVRVGGRVVAALRLSAPYALPSGALWQLAGFYLVGTVLVVLAGGLVAWLLKWRLVGAVERLETVLRQHAAGALSARVGPSESEPLGRLGAALNQAGAALEARQGALEQRLNEREAVLASMMEGVLAVDTEARLLDFNPAAASILGLQAERARSRHLIEVVRLPAVQHFVYETLASPTPTERELTLPGATERLLQAHGTQLRDSAGHTLGALVVLNDITQMRRLESVRRDFVANVSHELKTPITSIKGFVESLLDGAVDDPEQARHFLGIVARHTERLAAIIDDLLKLSRIEQESGREGLHTEPVRVREVLQASVQVCQVQSTARHIAVSVEVPDDLQAELNAPLVEQALVNLVDNAIKYSPEGTAVRLAAEAAGGEVVLAVTDEGPGIDSPHLPRLFERFYRVDKARSRKQGGTGLGLAIVKHIAQAHGGRVTVESRPGHGSTFRLHLPRGTAGARRA